MPKLPHNLALVEKLKAKTSAYLNQAPVISSAALKEKIGADVQLKIESLQPSGSFKIRGALAFLTGLKDGGYNSEVICASDGNHARATALAAQILKLPSRIFLPQTTEAALIDELKTLGAEVEAIGFSLDESKVKAQSYCEENEKHFVPSGDNPMTLAGVAVSATELLETFSKDQKIGTLVLPVGTGSLALAVGGLLKQEQPNIHVVGVQEEKLCEGPPSEKTGEILDQIIDEVVQVSRASIEKAITFLFQEHHLVVDSAGAMAVAALLDDSPSIHGRQALAYVTGGNLSAEALTKILAKGL
jgi:threonine dehydratase